jgi:hypothetical protein
MLALAGGLLFLVNLARLFRQPPLPRSGLPEPLANQEEVDAIATRFTRLSGAYLLLGLVLGVVLAWWKPDSGRWELAWAHLLLLGFFLTMASGVCYHVLSRWSGVAWRSPRAVRVHFGLVAFGLPLMVLALMFDLRWLFVVAGPIQAVALALFLVNVVPVAWRGPSLVRWGMFLAAAFLLAGITMGSLFASDVTLGPRLRQAHVTANLFGWSGLLISAFGYAFVPRFAGTSWRSPWLPRLQVGVLATGVAMATTAWIWRGLAGAPDWAVVVPQVVVAVGLLAFAVQVAAAFMAAPGRQLHVLRMREGQAARPLPAGREWAAGRRDALP